MSRGSILLLLCCLQVAVTIKAEESHWGQGPIELGSQYFFSQFHHTTSPTSPMVLPLGESEVRSAVIWSNGSIVEEDEYVADVESLTVPLEFRYGLTDQLQLGLMLPLRWQGAGRLDPFIDSWHRFFSMPRGDRRKVDDNQFEVSGRNDDGSTFNFDDAGWSVGNLTLATKYLLTRGVADSPAWSAEFSLALPTGDAQYSQQSIDVSAGLLGSLRLGEWISYWGGTLLYYADTRSQNVNFAALHVECFVSEEYEYRSDTSLLVSFHYSSNTVREIVGHPEYAIYFDLGLKHKLNQRNTLEILLRENPMPGDGTEDVSFLLGFSHRI